jgi:hypothetical protein
MRKIVEMILMAVFLLLPQVVFGQSRALDLIKWDSGGIEQTTPIPISPHSALATVRFTSSEVSFFAMSAYLPDTFLRNNPQFSHHTEIEKWRRELIVTWLKDYTRLSGLTLEEILSTPIQGTKPIGELGVADTVTFRVPYSSGREVVFIFLAIVINNERYWLTFVTADNANGYHPGKLNTATLQKFLASLKLASPKISQTTPGTLAKSTPPR